MTKNAYVGDTATYWSKIAHSRLATCSRLLAVDRARLSCCMLYVVFVAYQPCTCMLWVLSRVSMLTRDIDIAILSVCLSVCLSLTFRYSMETATHIITVSSLHGSPIILVLWISNIYYSSDCENSLYYRTSRDQPYKLLYKLMSSALFRKIWCIYLHPVRSYWHFFYFT